MTEWTVGRAFMENIYKYCNIIEPSLALCVCVWNCTVWMEDRRIYIKRHTKSKQIKVRIEFVMQSIRRWLSLMLLLFDWIFIHVLPCVSRYVIHLVSLTYRLFHITRHQTHSSCDIKWIFIFFIYRWRSFLINWMSTEHRALYQYI